MNIIEEIKLLINIDKLYKMLQEVMKMKNWRTTLVGLIGAVANVAYPLLHSGTVSIEAVIQAVVIAAIGFLAKDFNVSGTGV